MKLFRITTPLFLLVLTAMSIQAQNLKQYIPNDATFVVSVDLANLDSKISFDKLLLNHSLCLFTLLISLNIIKKLVLKMHFTARALNGINIL